MNWHDTITTGATCALLREFDAGNQHCVCPEWVREAASASYRGGERYGLRYCQQGRSFPEDWYCMELTELTVPVIDPLASNVRGLAWAVQDLQSKFSEWTIPHNVRVSPTEEFVTDWRATP